MVRRPERRSRILLTRLRPISIYALTCGCTLLLLGSVSDVVGSKVMYLTGCLLQSCFTLACGLAQNGTQLIVFRAFAGVAISFCLPSAVSIITSSFPEGKSRNIAFASMGGGQPIGFSFGLVLGGVFTDTIGWRWGFYLCAVINTIVFMIALFGLPKLASKQTQVLYRLRTEIDWVGIGLGSASLALLSYCFAYGCPFAIECRTNRRQTNLRGDYEDPRTDNPRPSHYCYMPCASFHRLGRKTREAGQASHHSKLSMEEPHLQCHLSRCLHHMGRLQCNRDIFDTILPGCTEDFCHPDFDPLPPSSHCWCNRKHCKQSSRKN